MTPAESLLRASERARCDRPDRAGASLGAADAWLVRCPSQGGYRFLAFREKNGSGLFHWTDDAREAFRFAGACHEAALSVSRRYGGATVVHATEV